MAHIVKGRWCRVEPSKHAAAASDVAVRRSAALNSYILMACIVMIRIVMAYIIMACMILACIVMVMAYIGTA